MNANSVSSAPGALPLPANMAVRPQTRTLSRNTLIVMAVLLLHVGVIWALQSGLLIRAVELVMPVEIMTEFIEPPKPKADPVPPAPPKPAPVKKTVTQAPAAVAPMPLAIADPTPAPNAPTGSMAPQPAPAPIATPVAAVAVAPAAPPAPPVVQMPSSDADYLQNPRPSYPTMSRKLNEQGRSVVRVLIGADGQPQKAEIFKSSGYDRLDEAAMSTVMRWRYVPGKRGGVAETMWFNVPINWVLE